MPDHSSPSRVPAAPPDERALLSFSREQDLTSLRSMLLIRRFEEKVGQLFAMGEIGGYCHMAIGQEAVAVGLVMARGPNDQVIASYRSHAHMLVAGMSPAKMMAELLGRRSGYSKGKGGSMHMFSRAARFYGGHGFAGASVPIGAGLALANRYRGNDEVCWCLVDFDAARLGSVHETFAIAQSLRLPVVFVIENNAHVPGESPRGVVAPGDLSQRGRPYGIPGWQVDGMDVRAVYDAGRRAGAWTRAGNGPFILEALTLPYRGHAMPDPVQSLSPEDRAAARETSDPIAVVRARLVAGGAVERDLKQIDNEVRRTINDAAAAAQKDALPDASELDRDVAAVDE